MTTAAGSFVSFAAALATAALFVLQVAGVIHVSWWLVFAPILVTVGLGIAMAIAFLGVAVVLALFQARR